MSTSTNKVAAFMEGFGVLMNKDAGRSDVSDGDISIYASAIVKKVTNFCIENNLAKAGDIDGNHFTPVQANEALGVEAALVTTTNVGIKDLIVNCGVTGEFVEPACKAVTNIMSKYFKDKGLNLFLNHKKKVEKFGHDTQIMNMESLYPSQLVDLFNTAFATEDLGVGMNTIIPDLRMAVSVAIMQFHNGLTARVVPVRTATESVVQYKRPDLKVYNVAETEEKDRDLIELFKNPKFLTNQLIQIKALKANDSGTDPVLVSDEIIKFDVRANLFKLGLDATKYGTDRFNRTDVVADGVAMTDVYFDLSDGTTVERFKVKIPAATNKLVMQNNALHSGIRAAGIEFATFLNKDSLKANGTVSVLLAAFEDEGLNINIKVNPEINLRNSDVISLGRMTVSKHHISDMTLISAGLNTFYTSLFAASGAHKPVLVGYSVDAKYDEQNLRKSQIATRIQTRHIVMPIPPGKNYILDSMMGQNEEENGASYLTQIIRIGQDDKTLTTIQDTLKHVFDLCADMFSNPLQKGIDPAHAYVSGSIVRPRVTLANLNINDLTTMRDSDRISDIRSMAQYKISYMIENQLSDTMLISQLPAGQRPTYRVVTSSLILNTIFAVQHIHNHLNNHAQPAYDGIEYRRVLDSGITLEFVTSLFEEMQDKIIIIPIIPGAPDSNLNWGHNWDAGTVVGNYNHSQDTAVWNRMFANTREITLPTNPMGMIITVQGIEAAMKLPD